MSSIVSDYYDSTKSIFIALIAALILTLTANFLFACLGFTIYIIIANSLPIIKQHKLDLLRDSLIDIRKCITYNVVLVIFVIILAYNVLFI